MSDSRPALRPLRWLAHLPLVILPFVAALAIEGPRLRAALAARSAAGSGVMEGVDLAAALLLIRLHWFWMLVALGLGAWVGWRSAGEAGPGDAPEDGA